MPLQISDEDLQAALPDLTGTMMLAGLTAPVQIYRDAWGIPHIRAENEHDLFFAQGFATAQDRLWQMDFDRHQALGRWSEFAGRSGLARDRLLRAAGMGRTAQKDYGAASERARATVDAYAAGVNAFIQSTRSLPIEYEILDALPAAWENWHCLAVYKMRNTLLGTFEPKLLRTRLAATVGAQQAAAVLKGYTPGQLLTVPPGAVYEGTALDGVDALRGAYEEAGWLREVGAGSNGWSISGQRTRSGLPLVAGDSHRALDVPNVYYQMHLACPEFKISGHAVPGMPGALHFCHNQHVAWGMTYGSADTQDLFIERFRDTPDGREYEFKGQWLKADVLHETIHVRGAEPVELDVTITHHGPVIVGDPTIGLGISISDPGLAEATPWLDAALDAMRARSVQELHEALRNWTDRVNNYAVADVHGHFGYLHAGRLPIRPASNGWRAVPGWTGEHEWAGYIPHDELPKAIDPQTGYAVTCNQRVAGHDYPYYVGLHFTPDYRARRVQTRIEALEPHTASVADMSDIHGDRVSIPAQVFTKALRNTAPQDAVSERALALLGDWDHSMDRDLVQPTIYVRTRQIVVRRIVETMLEAMAAETLSGTPGGDVHVRQIEVQMIDALRRGDGAMLGEGQDWPQMLAWALKQAVAELSNELGDDMTTWRWGRVHRTAPRHPLSLLHPHLSDKLDPPALALHGDGETPLAGNWAVGNEFVATSSSVNRYIHDPSDWTNSRWIVPLGASGHPASPHYADQAPLWSNVQTIEQLWDWGRIVQEAQTCQVLEPKGRKEPQMDTDARG